MDACHFTEQAATAGIVVLHVGVLGVGPDVVLAGVPVSCGVGVDGDRVNVLGQNTAAAVGTGDGSGMEKWGRAHI